MLSSFVARLTVPLQFVSLHVSLYCYILMKLPYAVSGPVEEDPEYKLIVEANNLTLKVDNEIGKTNCKTTMTESHLNSGRLTLSAVVIGVIHKFLRDKYSKRFPELEQLVLHPLDYFRTVKVSQILKAV